jgi:VCBS repeat-containing protein
MSLSLADVDGTVAIDVPWLESLGWNTADGGLTDTHGGDYGIAALDTATGIVNDLLDNTLPATIALVNGQTVFDPFTFQVVDNSGATADATAVFTIDGSDTPSTFTANVAGYASVSSANPTAATLGILNPANTLLISTPAKAGVIDIFNVQWEWFDINTNTWVSIPGANSLTHLPNDFDAVPFGSVIHAW